MMRTLVDHARRHVIGYCALGCALLALGGTAYAQFAIPNGAVGERQLRNYAIDPVKWDPAYVTGFVRRWATVSPAGALLSSSPGGQAKATGTGSYEVTWGDAFAGWCAPLATVMPTPTPTPTPTTTTTTTTTTTSTTSTTGTTTTPTPSPANAGYANASVHTRNGQSTLVAVSTYNSQGQPSNQQFSLAVVCGPGAGSGQTVPSTLP